MPLEYIRRIRLRQSWLDNEINHRRELKEILKYHKGSLAWLKIIIAKSNNWMIISDMLKEQDLLIREIKNIELDITYSTSRLKYYIKICKITSTLG